LYVDFEYNQSGYLTYASFEFYNESSNTESIIFEIEVLQDKHLENFALGVEVGNFYSWLVLDVNNSAMEVIFGSDWEQFFGLPENPQPLQKTQIQITSIIDNNTHWDVSYNTWNWINRANNFGVISDSSDSIVYRQDPFNYTKPFSLPNSAPFFVPRFPAYYLEFCYLNESFHEDPYLDPFNNTDLDYDADASPYDFNGNVAYNENGILEMLEFYVYYENEDDDYRYDALTMVQYFDGPKVDYVGVNESLFNLLNWRDFLEHLFNKFLADHFNPLPDELLLVDFPLFIVLPSILYFLKIRA